MSNHVYYRVWWALGGYRHYDTEEEARAAKHPKGGFREEIDEPVRIDKIEIIFNDESAEDRVQDKRRRLWEGKRNG